VRSATLLTGTNCSIEPPAARAKPGLSAYFVGTTTSTSVMSPPASSATVRMRTGPSSLVHIRAGGVSVHRSCAPAAVAISSNPQAHRMAARMMNTSGLRAPHLL
jgi:hypothetical protein